MADLEIPFTKMVASGNDFVVLDNRKGAVRDLRSFAKAVCERREGIGADGVLLVENSNKADYRMRILNADGSEAEACGNGFRCLTLFAHSKLGFPKKHNFESLSGIVQAEMEGVRIRVRLPDAKQFKPRNEIQIDNRKLGYFFINTGVPHAVIFVEGIDKIAVNTLGPAIRNHDRFKPAGTNVNFVEVKGPGEIQVRTYERGVEGETLACGTGSSASAIVSVKAGYGKPPVRVKTESGEILLIDFKIQGEKITDVTLEGQARFVFEGEWKIQ